MVGLKLLPGVGALLSSVLKSEASNFIKQTPIGGGAGGKVPKVRIPEKGSRIFYPNGDDDDNGDDGGDDDNDDKGAQGSIP